MLHWAAASLDDDDEARRCVPCLVQVGPGHQMAPVHDAAKQNDVPALLALLEGDPALVHAESHLHKRQDTPLHFACEAGAAEAAQLLLDRGAVIDKGNAFEVTSLMLACCAGRAEVVSLLLARGADPTLPSSASWTALIEAAAGLERPGSDHVAVLRLLLQDGRVAVNARTHTGATALSWACCRGHADRAHVLLVEGAADHRVADEDQRTPMQAARQESQKECVRLLQVSGHPDSSPALMMHSIQPALRAAPPVLGAAAVVRGGARAGLPAHQGSECGG